MRNKIRLSALPLFATNPSTHGRNRFRTNTSLICHPSPFISRVSNWQVPKSSFISPFLCFSVYRLERTCHFSVPTAATSSSAGTSNAASSKPSSHSSSLSSAAFSQPPRPKFSAQFAGSSLSTLLGYYKALSKYQPFIGYRLILAVLCIATSKFLGICVPLLYERIIDLLTTYSSSAQAGVLHTAKCVRTIFMAVITYGTLRILTSITHELRNGIFSKAGFRVGRTVTAECFSHLLSLEAAFHNSAQTGAVVRVVERGSRSVMVIFRGLLFAFFPSVLELALVCVVLFRRFSIWYAFITAVTFVLYLTWTLWINKELGDVRTQMNLVESEGSAKLTDSLMNIESVKSFHNGAFEYCRYDETLERYETGAIRSDWLYVALNVGQSSIFTIGMLVMFSQASLGVLDGSRTVASVVMLGAMMRQLWQPLNFLGWQYREVKQSLIDIQQLFEVMQRAPKIQDVTNAKALKVTGGEIVFDNVSFQYPEADDKLSFMRKPATGGAKEQGSENEDGGKKAALEGLSFKVPAGKSLAIVGPSGSGKSTTTRLLYRLYELSGGCISIDGQDISNATIASLRKAVSIVPQDTSLFNDTIAYNIRYGRPSATDEEVVAAAKAASIHDVIMATAQGYDTLVGERGVRVSGGERQRLSVARAFLKGSKIIVEDESTSALDTLTEMEVTQALKKLGINRTRIIVAHRLSTIMNVDNIIVLQHGRKVEEGTHAQLLQINNGVFKGMWERQQRKISTSETATTLQ